MSFILENRVWEEGDICRKREAGQRSVPTSAECHFFFAQFQEGERWFPLI